MTEHLSKDQILIRKLTEIILADLGNEYLDAQKLSTQLRISHYSLDRRLYTLTNKTVRQFIHETRLLRALEILQDEELTTSEVAYKVGFRSTAYFNTCFHEFFGYSPEVVKKGNFNKQGDEKIDNIALKHEIEKTSTRVLIFISSMILIISFSGYAAYIISHGKLSQTVVAPLKIPQKSIAILPFKNLSNNLDDRYIYDGVMDEILTNLRRIHHLRIVSRISVEQFRESTESASEIAKKVDVDYIVEGSGQKYGNTFLLRVQLIEASTDKHIWARLYEKQLRETKDIFKIQSQVAQNIAEELVATITHEEKLLIEKSSTTNLTAYDFYKRGTDELNFFDIGNQAPSAKLAEKMFRKALEYDSTFARAYSGLAGIYFRNHFYDSFYTENYLDSTLILADRALVYDDHLAESYLYRAAYYLVNGRTEEGINECNKSLKYNPNYWELYFLIAHNVYLWNNYYGDYVKAIECLQKAADINHGKELPDILTWLANAYGYFAGFPENAKYYYKDVLKLDGDSISYFNRLAELEHNLGNNNQAIELLEKNYARDTNNMNTIQSLGSYNLYIKNYKESLRYYKRYAEGLASLKEFQTRSMLPIGYTYLQNGYKKEAEHWFKEQKRLSEVSIKKGRLYSSWGYANLDLAAMYALIGEKEKAYKQLKIFSSIKVFPYSGIIGIKNDPCFNNIRDEPEFQRIVRDLEAKYQAEHERVRKWLQDQRKL